MSRHRTRLRRRILFHSTVVTALLALVVGLGLASPPASRSGRGLPGAGLLQGHQLLPRLDPRRDRRHPAARREHTTSRSRRPPTPPRSPTPTSHGSTRSSSTTPTPRRTSGDLLDAAQRAALQNFVRGGGGWVGLHAASASERDWTWYEGLVGTIFDNHPDFRRPAASSRAGQGARPRAPLHARACRSSGSAARSGTTGAPTRPARCTRSRRSRCATASPGWTRASTTPYSWCQNYDGGRSWFTAGGHAKARCSTSRFPRPPALRYRVGGRRGRR